MVQAITFYRFHPYFIFWLGALPVKGEAPSGGEIMQEGKKVTLTFDEETSNLIREAQKLLGEELGIKKVTMVDAIRVLTRRYIESRKKRKEG
jgi:hypothetical protein